MERFSKVQLERRKKGLIAHKLGTDLKELSLSSDFAGDLGADSLDVVETIMLMESELGISISDAEGEEVHTVNDLYEICFQKLTEQQRIIG